jgi:predicted RNase H-like HicB family nuclease
MKLTADLDREEDGRWIAEALELPGVMCYGQTSDRGDQQCGTTYH